MIDTAKAIFTRLKEDTTLVNMLPSNAPFHDPKGTRTKANSIVPASQIRPDMEKPLVTVQEGTETRIGQKFEDEVFFIRCYNVIDKTYVEIDQVLARIKVLLDDYDFIFDNSVNVRTRYEIILPGLVDEGLNLRFREQRFRIYKL